MRHPIFARLSFREMTSNIYARISCDLWVLPIIIVVPVPGAEVNPEAALHALNSFRIGNRYIPPADSKVCFESS